MNSFKRQLKTHLFRVAYQPAVYFYFLIVLSYCKVPLVELLCNRCHRSSAMRMMMKQAHATQTFFDAKYRSAMRSKVTHNFCHSEPSRPTAAVELQRMKNANSVNIKLQNSGNWEHVKKRATASYERTQTDDNYWVGTAEVKVNVHLYSEVTI